MNWLRTSGEARSDWLQEPEHREERSAGWFASSWITGNCVHTSSKWVGRPFELLPWEVRLLVELLELRDDGLRRHRWSYISLAKKQGKTELCAALALWLAIGAPEAATTSPLVVVAAGNDDQADLLFSAARRMVERSPTLSQVVSVYEGELVIPEIDSRIVRVSASARKHGSNLDGKNVSGLFCDELHVWEGSRGELVHGTLARSTGAREQPLVVQLTTAGFDRDSICWRQYERAKAAILNPEDDPAFYSFIAEAPDDCDLTDESFEKANPSYGTIVSPDFYRDQVGSMPETDVRRFFLNQWVSMESESWLADLPGAWSAGEGEPTIIDGAPTYVGVDVALRRDTTAVVIVQEHAGKFHVRSRVWTADDGKIDHLSIINYIRSLDNQYRLLEVVYDPRFFEVPSIMLSEEGINMVELPQHPSRMMGVCAAGYDALAAGLIVHDGDQVLTDHVQSAVRREYPDGWTLSKGKSRRHIDACIAMLLALHRAQVSNTASFDPPPIPKVYSL